MRDPFGDANVKYLNCIDINILVVLLYPSFKRCYLCENLGEWYKGSLYYFLLLYLDMQLS